jgi:putative flippase GtrA
VLDVRRLLHYATVSLVATGVSQVVLATLVATRATGAAEANVIATLVGTVPSFELNRRWVWGKRGRRSIASEIAPFAAISATGLVLSTLAVAVASGWADAVGLGATTRTLTVQCANLAAFGVVWVAQFIVLDKVLFPSQRIPRELAGGTEGILRFADERGVHEHDHLRPTLQSADLDR